MSLCGQLKCFASTTKGHPISCYPSYPGTQWKVNRLNDIRATLLRRITINQLISRLGPGTERGYDADDASNLSETMGLSYTWSHPATSQLLALGIALHDRHFVSLNQLDLRLEVTWIHLEPSWPSLDRFLRGLPTSAASELTSESTSVLRRPEGAIAQPKAWGSNTCISAYLELYRGYKSRRSQVCGQNMW